MPQAVSAAAARRCQIFIKMQISASPWDTATSTTAGASDSDVGQGLPLLGAGELKGQGVGGGGGGVCVCVCVCVCIRCNLISDCTYIRGPMNAAQDDNIESGCAPCARYLVNLVHQFGITQGLMRRLSLHKILFERSDKAIEGGCPMNQHPVSGCPAKQHSILSMPMNHEHHHLQSGLG